MVTKGSSMKRMNSQGSAVKLVIIGVVVLALLGVLGYVFYVNYLAKDSLDPRVGSLGDSKDTTANLEPAEVTADPNYEGVYHDYRKKGDTTGVALKTDVDIDTLEDLGDGLVVYLSDGLAGGSTYVIDRTYGNYAVGTESGVSAYQLWGPDTDGNVSVVAGTQNVGFDCNTLMAAEVPAKLVDGKCADGTGVVDYNG